MFLVADESLFEETLAWTARFDELVDLEGDGSWCGHFRGELWIQAEHDRVRVTGPLTGQVPRECDLCLGHYLEAIEVTLVDLCLIDPAAAGDGAQVFDEDGEVWRVQPEGRISLTEMVRQAAVLELPTRAICGDDCPAKPALAERAKSGGAPDPRLEILRGLLEAEEEDDGGPEATNE